MDGNCDNLDDTELRLGLPGIDVTAACSKVNKRALTEDFELKRPSAKAQVVGWPPVRSNRRNSIQARRSEAAEIADAGIFLVKVSMDGAPYLRKIDLMIYKGYKELRDALENMFKCFSFGSLECENLEVGATSGTEYAIAYEDKDGDWMLAGDVPWEMFISSCRRLRIMKGTEAKGLASNLTVL